MSSGTPSQQAPTTRRVQRAIVLTLLIDENRPGCSLNKIEQQLDDISGETIAEALASLCASGVVKSEAGRIVASSATQGLDELDLIGS